MRHTVSAALVVLAACTTVLASPDRAEAPPIADEHVEEALVEAGENRAQLERALQLAADHDDPLALTSMRFLIANMTGKGYVRTELHDAEGNTIPFDTMAYPKFKQSLEALEALEKEHGELHWERSDLVKDTQTITAEFLIRHVELSLRRWRESPLERRVGFEAFLNYVLPYRGSQEPIDDWLTPMSERYRSTPDDTLGDVRKLYKWVTKDVSGRVRFDERFYLHPTDQGFSEMEESRLGRCEDITNMQTFAARSLALATAADYTPAWAHRDNNHAWNVLLDADGVGFTKAYDHAAKVYRKTFAIQRDALAFQLPEGREAANRFMASTGYVDVTDQYMTTTDVTVTVDLEAAGEERFAYLCVFNGGDWSAIHWAPIEGGNATFTSMGRNIVYLPAVHDGSELVAVGDPLLLHHNGAIETLRGGAATTDLVATSLKPRQKSVDTHVETPESHLEPGQEYVLRRWQDGDWTDVTRFDAGDEPHLLRNLPSGALYWLVKPESRKLERVFTIESGRQRWW